MQEPPAATYRVSGAAIRNRRMELGLTIADCADKAGISDGYLKLLELGYRKRMRPPRYAALRTALDLELEDRRLLALPDGSPRKE